MITTKTNKNIALIKLNAKRRRRFFREERIAFFKIIVGVILLTAFAVYKIPV